MPVPSSNSLASLKGQISKAKAEILVLANATKEEEDSDPASEGTPSPRKTPTRQCEHFKRLVTLKNLKRGYFEQHESILQTIRADSFYRDLLDSYDKMNPEEKLKQTSGISTLHLLKNEKACNLSHVHLQQIKQIFLGDVFK